MGIQNYLVSKQPAWIGNLHKRLQDHGASLLHNAIAANSQSDSLAPQLIAICPLQSLLQNNLGEKKPLKRILTVHNRQTSSHLTMLICIQAFANIATPTIHSVI